MAEECLICKQPLEYLQAEVPMTCSVCGAEKPSRTQCVSGHFVCDSCHMHGVDEVVSLCLAQTSPDPLEILELLMAQPTCHMHGPEHHVLVGAALLTAYRNAGGQVDLGPALLEMAERGKQVPGGACGFWGACGAGISAGMFVSIATRSTPLKNEEWGLSNSMTSLALASIGEVGGPRCCKRDSYLAVLAAVDFARVHLGVQMRSSRPTCTRQHLNAQCIGARCPFSPRA